MRTSITAALPLALALALAACGGGSDTGNADAGGAEATETAAAETRGDPCRFITGAEMTAITTDAVIELIPEDDSCTYRSNPNDGPRVVVKTANAEKEMENARRAAGLLDGMGAAVADKGGAGADAAAMMKQKTDTPGVGDESLWGMVGILYARKGDTYVEVFPPTLHDPATHKGYPLVGAEEKRRIVVAIANRVFAKTGA